MTTKPIKVFYSYAHEDEELRDALAKHLSILKHEGIIQEWHDRCIEAGQNWGSEIDQNLESADLLLLLVSAAFIASDYCFDSEVKRAMDRHNSGVASVIPIILRPVDWRRAPFGKLQCLPTNAKAVTLWTNRDEAFTDITLGIRKVVEEFQKKIPSNRIQLNPILGNTIFAEESPMKQIISLKLEKTLDPPKREIWEVAITPEGDYLVTAFNDRNVRIWDVATGALLDTLTAHEDNVMSVSVSPDGSRAATGSSDQTIRVWDLKSHKLVREIKYGAKVNTVAWSPNSKEPMLASGAADRSIKLWNVQNATMISELRGHEGQVYQVVFSEDANSVISASGDRTIGIWNLSTVGTKRIIHAERFIEGHEQRVKSVAIVKGKGQFLSGSEDQTLRLWDFLGNCLGEMRGHEGDIWRVAVSPDGALGASVAEDCALILWDLKTYKELHKLDFRNMGFVADVTFSPNGKYIAAGLRNGSVYVYRIER